MKLEGGLSRNLQLALGLAGVSAVLAPTVMSFSRTDIPTTGIKLSEMPREGYRLCASLLFEPHTEEVAYYQFAMPGSVQKVPTNQACEIAPYRGDAIVIGTAFDKDDDPIITGRVKFKIMHGMMSNPITAPGEEEECDAGEGNVECGDPESEE